MHRVSDGPGWHRVVAQIHNLYRLVPLLSTTITQHNIWIKMHRVSDGPGWQQVVAQIHNLYRVRVLTLLHNIWVLLLIFRDMLSGWVSGWERVVAQMLNLYRFNDRTLHCKFMSLFGCFILLETSKSKKDQNKTIQKECCVFIPFLFMLFFFCFFCSFPPETANKTKSAGPKGHPKQETKRAGSKGRPKQNKTSWPKGPPQTRNQKSWLKRPPQTKQ